MCSNATVFQTISLPILWSHEYDKLQESYIITHKENKITIVFLDQSRLFLFYSSTNVCYRTISRIVSFWHYLNHFLRWDKLRHYFNHFLRWDKQLHVTFSITNWPWQNIDNEMLNESTMGTTSHGLKQGQMELNPIKHSQRIYLMKLITFLGGTSPMEWAIP